MMKYHRIASNYNTDADKQATRLFLLGKSGNGMDWEKGHMRVLSASQNTSITAFMLRLLAVSYVACIF